MNSTIGNADLLRLLPPSLKEDPKIVAFAEVFAEELKRTYEMIPQNVIYARIDELGEEILDILAYDMHVDWYDYSYSLDVKRRTIRDSIGVHKQLGTKYAVETALGNVLPGTEVKEWFEYGGNPFCFKLIIDTTFEFMDKNAHDCILSKVNFYKNIRSRLDGIEYIIKLLRLEIAVKRGYASFTTKTLKEIPAYNCWCKKVWFAALTLGYSNTTLVVLQD